MEQINPRSRRDAYGKKINRDHSPALVYGVPCVTIMLGSLFPLLPVIAPAPIMPPMGLMVLLAWRLLRPGLLPLWVGFPFGLFDDLFSGQPLGSGIMLFSLALIALDLLELRLPWRNFWQNWLTGAVVLTVYLLLAAIVSGADFRLAHFGLLLPQLLLAILLFPIISSLIVLLDRGRLMRVRRIG
ncbi:rod shape-determining protein MreD [Alteraurantiacibacter palmitatis]|uniref:Rod shape-determining protein MreD n=1 Tax=Alteraurantiacibacter palmitatis TaxID=2054628 RepID=A0ABV7E7G7_9SPHN